MKIFRKLVAPVVWVIGLVATASFVVADRLSDQNPLYKSLWHTCAACTLFDFLLGSMLKALDNREEQKKREVDNKNLAVLTRMTGNRHLSETNRLAWKLALSEFAGQRFKVFQIGMTNFEAAYFAREIHSALQDCGWIGEFIPKIPATDPRLIFSGVAVHLNIEAGDEWVPSTSKAIGELLNQIRTCKISEGGGAFPVENLPKGTIGVVVGQKP